MTTCIHFQLKLCWKWAVSALHNEAFKLSPSHWGTSARSTQHMHGSASLWTQPSLLLLALFFFVCMEPNILCVIGERERANIVVRTARIFYDRTSSNCACYALLFIQKDFKISHAAWCRAYRCAYSPGKMPFVVEERGKENIVPVRLLSREALLYECDSIAKVYFNWLGDCGWHGVWGVYVVDEVCGLANFSYGLPPSDTVMIIHLSKLCVPYACLPSLYTVHFYSCNCLWKRFRKLEECCQVVSTPLKTYVSPSSSPPPPSTPRTGELYITPLLCKSDRILLTFL